MKIKELLFALLFISACKTDIPDVAVSTNYPPTVEKIIIGKCATAGCHNSISNSAAGGLDLSSWDVMFNVNCASGNCSSMMHSFCNYS